MDHITTGRWKGHNVTDFSRDAKDWLEDEPELDTSELEIWEGDKPSKVKIDGIMRTVREIARNKHNQPIYASNDEDSIVFVVWSREKYDYVIIPIDEVTYSQMMTSETPYQYPLPLNLVGKTDVAEA